MSFLELFKLEKDKHSIVPSFQMEPKTKKSGKKREEIDSGLEMAF